MDRGYRGRPTEIYMYFRFVCAFHDIKFLMNNTFIVAIVQSRNPVTKLHSFIYRVL